MVHLRLSSGVSYLKIAHSFRVIKNFVHFQNKKKLYYAYAYSKISYGIEVYGLAAKEHINKLQIQQNRVLKILYNKDFMTPTNTLHKELELLKVDDIFQLKILQFIHKHKNKKLPKIFVNLFITNANVHDHVTRFHQNIYVNDVRTENGKKSIKYYGAKVWNNLNLNTREISSPFLFKSTLRSAYINKYEQL